MARYNGTTSDDTVAGALSEADTFSNFGIGFDKVTGGFFNDTFSLLVDEKTDTISGGKGEDSVDYSLSDRGLTIDLAAGKVTAVFGGGLKEIVHVGTVANLTGIEDAIGSRFNDTLIGTSGSTTLEGGGGADKIYGGGTGTASYAHSAAAVQIDLNQTVQHGGDAEGDQLYGIQNVIGSSQNDHIVGSWSGNNTIEGGAGADWLSGGSISIYKGSHFDENTVSYVHSSAAVQIDLNQTVQHGGDAEGDQLWGFDKVSGSAFNDQITGNSANNTLNGGAGDDTLFHTAGSDYIDGGAGEDTYVVGHLDGTSGVTITLDDQVVGYEFVTTPFGGQTLVPEMGTLVEYSVNQLTGRPDVDQLTGIENLVGSQNDDFLDGSNVSADVGTVINGAGGIDYVHGGGGSDQLYGGTGNDNLFGGAGDDHLYGEGDDDWLVGGAGADRLDGGSGNNTADYSASAAGVNVHLERTNGYYTSYIGYGKGGDAEGDVLVSIQNLIGSNQDDTLEGGHNANILNGGLGNDTLVGGGGNDTLIGGLGDDTLTGGADADTFYYELFNDSAAANIGNDTITDYQAGVDTLQLGNISSGQAVHVVQDHDNAVITIDNVVGSITLLNMHAADVAWMH